MGSWQSTQNPRILFITVNVIIEEKKKRVIQVLCFVIHDYIGNIGYQNRDTLIVKVGTFYFIKRGRCHMIVHINNSC